MEDEIDLLRTSAPLRTLLNHYAAAADPAAWQDRLMRLDGVPVEQLVALHGGLLAHQWLEQNTGVIGKLMPGTVPGCYSATRPRHNALAIASRPRDDEECAGTETYL